MADVSIAFQLTQDATVDPYPGWLLLPFKDALVSAGWTVRGSGDGLGRFGHIDAATSVPLAQRGSGGEYDCWSVANVSNGTAGGAGNSQGWCHLRDPNGTRDLLVGADPATSSPQSHLGVLGLTRQDAAGLDGASSNATTKPTPAVASDIYWEVGFSAASGGYLYSATTAAGDTLKVGMVILDGGAEWAMWPYYYDSSAGLHDFDTSANWTGVVSVENPHPDDPDPWYYLRSYPSTQPVALWNYRDSAYYSSTSAGGVIAANDTRTAPAEEAAYPLIDDDATAPTMVKGVANRDMLLSLENLHAWGERATEVGSGRIYVHVQPIDNALLFVRWPDAVTAVEGATMSDFDVWDPFYVAPSASAATYVNRVWDTSAGSFVRWRSSGTADSAGASYPGPGTFGVDTSDYCVESIL